MATVAAPYFPIEKEPKIMTLDKPLILESAFPGWLSTKVNPNIPIKTEEISKEVIDSVKAGATAIHVHPRDPVTGGLTMDPDLLKRTLDPVFEECGKVLTWNHAWTGKINEPVDYRTHVQEILNFKGGRKYIQSSVVLIRASPSRPM